MRKVQLPDAVLAPIGEPGADVQLCDESGQVRGFFVTADIRLMAYEHAKSLFADDDTPPYVHGKEEVLPTTEAIAYLRRREADYRGRG